MRLAAPERHGAKPAGQVEAQRADEVALDQGDAHLRIAAASRRRRRASASSGSPSASAVATASAASAPGRAGHHQGAQLERPHVGHLAAAACSAAYRTASQLPSASDRAAGSRSLAGQGDRIAASSQLGSTLPVIARSRPAARRCAFAAASGPTMTSSTPKPTRFMRRSAARWRLGWRAVSRMTAAPAGMRLVSQASRADSGARRHRTDARQQLAGTRQLRQRGARRKPGEPLRRAGEVGGCHADRGAIGQQPSRQRGGDHAEALEGVLVPGEPAVPRPSARRPPAPPSRPRAGSRRRLTVLPSRAVARQWMWRSESPGWNGRTPANSAGSTVREWRARRSPSGDISRSACRTSAIAGATMQGVGLLDLLLRPRGGR